MRRMLCARTLALSLVGLAGLTFQSAGAPAKTYDIAAILSLTGNGAFLGKEQKAALQVAEKVINATGGLHGKNVHFVFYDDQTSPQNAVQLANQVIASKPAAILGSSLVASCNAMAPLMRNGPVMYCLSPGIRPSAGSYIFTASAATGDEPDAQIRYFRLKGWKRIAIMTSADATGQVAELGLDKVLARPENKDVTVVDRAHFNLTDVSVAAQIEHIKQAKPQVLIAWSTGSPIATVFKGIVQAGLDIPVATTAGNMTYAQMRDYAAFLPKQLFIASTEWVPQNGVVKLDPGVEKAHQRFFDAFKTAKIKPDFAATLSWDPAMLLVDALRHLDADAKPAQVRDYLARLQGFAGINGLYDFVKIPQRGLDVSDVVVTLWSPARQAWEVVSEPTGIPLAK